MTIPFRDQADCINRRRLLQAGAIAGLGALAPRAALAATTEAWPSRPINYIVPFAPGGLTDVAARTVAKALTDALGWHIIVENKPGGSGNIGAAHVARAAPNGYTWLGITLTHVANATLYEGRAEYDLLRDLVPLASLAASSMVVVVSAKSAIHSMADLAQAAQAGTLTAGSGGNGSPPHLTLALYQQLTGYSLTHVPYKGGTPSLIDLMGGHVDVVFSNQPESLAHIKSGALRALAVTSLARSADLPDVPTVAEVGLPKLISENMTGILAPAKTPAPLVQSLGNAIAAQVDTAATRKALSTLGFVPQPLGPTPFKAYLEAEVKRWRDIIRNANITVT